MNGFLLDTNVLLIAAFRSVTLSTPVRQAIETGPLFLSTISYWEVTLKSMKGKLDVGDPRSWWRNALDDLAATPMLLAPEHVAEISNLPAIHADPFDRALVAQAVSAELTLATTDSQVKRYASERLRVLS
ncbi:MAG: type II toxin-antitoxin system VapC family toxin [Candidatus Eremiobacteraeota bacterium]|nr:type II toxin-antitoxin system VapC family toxin [Candidatus Eremiobacteraeota bacterium]